MPDATPADVEPTTAELLAAWDAFDLSDYADDSEGFAALVAIAEPMVERLRAGVSPQPEITRQQLVDALDRVLLDYPPKTMGLINAQADAVWVLLADGATPAAETPSKESE